MRRKRTVSEMHSHAGRAGARVRWEGHREAIQDAIRPLLAQGLTLREIAKRLQMPYWTVVQYTADVRRELAGVQ